MEGVVFSLNQSLLRIFPEGKKKTWNTEEHWHWMTQAWTSNTDSQKHVQSWVLKWKSRHD